MKARKYQCLKAIINKEISMKRRKSRKQQLAGERRRKMKSFSMQRLQPAAAARQAAAAQLKSSKAKASINWRHGVAKTASMKMAKEIVNIKRRVASKM
jgi:hypothetical protein